MKSLNSLSSSFPQIATWIIDGIAAMRNKNNLIALFVEFFKSPKSEEYRKYTVWYVIIYIRDYISTFTNLPKI